MALAEQALERSAAGAELIDVADPTQRANDAGGGPLDNAGLFSRFYSRNTTLAPWTDVLIARDGHGTPWRDNETCSRHRASLSRAAAERLCLGAVRVHLRREWPRPRTGDDGHRTRRLADLAES